MVLPVRNARIRLSQGQLFSREVGHGRAIVFLHGSWSDGSEWLPVMEQLADQFHCLAPDLLGCGESDRLTLNYSVDSQVESLADYLEALKLRDLLLVGRG
ncbi:MAG: alpha/beta fold hydrolase [Leptolyngbyaceae cyanobacterium SL_7_1]|nr:alpha/beta fold hydrolase [Leptolyngbyaceae cyanobacterium SL_7_1]